MAINMLAVMLFAVFCGFWIDVECKKLSELGLAPKCHLSEDEDVDAEDLQDEEWKKFKAKFGKDYEHGAEEKAKKNFKENLKKVAEQNRKFLKHEASFKMKINEFSDWSRADIEKKLLSGIIMPDNSTIERRRSRSPKHSKALPPPAALDYRKGGFIRAVKNQNQAAVLESFFTSYFGLTVDISVQNLVDCSKNGNQGCTGGWPMNAFDWMKANTAFVESANYPFTGTVTDGQYLPEGDEEELKKVVWENHPVAAAINAGADGFIGYSGAGVFIDPNCSKAPNHAVLIVGYGSDNETGQGYWIIKNRITSGVRKLSWGTGWGDYGFIKMARNKGNQCGIASFVQYPVFR